MKSRAPSGVRLDEHRRLDLDEAVRVVDLADRLDHPAAQQEAVGHRLAAEVEVAVLQAEALVDRRVRLVDVERRGLGLGQDLDLGGPELDLAGRELGVLRARQPLGDRARDGDHELGADPARDGMRLGRVGLVDDDLGDAVPVAQVQEDQLAVVAATMDPAGEPRVAPASGPAARRRCGCDRAWRGWASGRAWPAYGSRRTVRSAAVPRDRSSGQPSAASPSWRGTVRPISSHPRKCGASSTGVQSRQPHGVSPPSSGRNPMSHAAGAVAARSPTSQ